MPSRYVAVTLKESQSDPFRAGVTVHIGSLNRRLCPVRAMASYLLVRGSAPGPLFVLGRWKSYTYLRYVDITDSIFVNPFRWVVHNGVEE